MTKKKAESVIAEATGNAGGTGAELGSRIEAAMGAAILECNARGVTDDTPPERVEALLGKGFKGKDGATVIREAKIAARLAVKRAEEAAAAVANAAD